LRETIAGYDLVVNAVPGFMGYETLERIIEEGKDVVDIAFSPEDLNSLNDLAVKKGVTALVDFGVAPGLSHLMVAHCSKVFDKLDRVRIFVGGLPLRRTKPFEYAAVFSPIDVIEEYTRPARLVQNGQLVIREALTEIEEMEFGKIGTLEAFNSDGLRSLVDSIEVDDMAEKTLRYPGHAALMKILRDTGFFDQEAITINGQELSPIEMTSKLLFPKWEMKAGDRDLTVMKVTAEGPIKGKKQLFVFDLYDELNNETGVHSMARTTGYTATMGVRVLLKKMFVQKGVFYPEKLGTNKEILDFILKGLEERGIELAQQYKPIS